MEIAEYLHNKFNKDNSQVSPVRTKGFKRHDLIKLFKKFNFNIGAEIGVAEGRFSEFMCKTIPDLNLYAIDPWEPHEYDPRSIQIGSRLADQRYEEAKERFRPFKVIIKRGTSMDMVREFNNESLDFAYIDGNHTFDFVIQDIIEWSKRVKSGGIVAGHDYYRFRWAGVVDAVDVYTRMHNIKEWYLTDERTPSFFWAKE